jgi:hypothetical protein
MVLPCAKPHPRDGEVLPACLIGVEKRAFELGPHALRPATDRRRSDQPGVGAPAREQPIDVVTRHQHVAVGNHDPIVSRRAPALEHVIELRVAAYLLVADEQFRAGFRALRHQRFDERNDGILFGSHAE